MALSVVSPIEPAIQRTKRILFRPFDLGKWMGLGFCAFLAHLYGGGISGRVTVPSRRDLEIAVEWIDAHLALVVILAALLLVIGLALTVLTVWLQARGRFMFLDGVVHDRGAVKEPWRRWRSQGNSLFRLTLVLHVGIVLAMLGFVALGTAVAWPDLESGRFGDRAWTGIAFGGVPLVLLWIAYGVMHMVLHDFVVPVMRKRGLDAVAGWKTAWREVIAAHPGVTALYVLMRLAILFATGLAMIALVCATMCLYGCLLAIPYVGSVAALPFLVFERCYALHFLRQLGDGWDLLDAAAPAPEVEPEPDAW